MDSTNCVHCKERGAQPETFVCQHILHSLVTKEPVGFFWAIDHPGPWPDAWCAQCDERVRRQGGEWAGLAAEHLGAKLLCVECYEVARRLNLGAQPPASSPGVV